jgi:perosamine synthetase
MHIFNSLGSNYNFRFVWQALFSNDFKPHTDDLKLLLEKKYFGKATLVYKGREAIFLALKAAQLPADSYVAINGFTCYAVYEAVRAGLNVHYLDIAPKSLHFSAIELEKALQENPKIRAVIIQNTLGAPCDIEVIATVCKKNNLVLIEDLAHSVGAVHSGGQEAGSFGDFLALSFGRDKIIDAASGGALIIRSRKYQDYKMPKLHRVDQAQQLRDMFYPLLTWKVRAAYEIGLGKPLHFLFNKLGLLTRGLGPSLKDPHYLPNWYSALVSRQFASLNKNLDHRRKISAIYSQTIDQKLQFLNTYSNNTAFLRFPIVVDKRAKLIEYMKGKNIHISDIWYDAPVAPAKYLKLTNYDGKCLQAEKIAATILNLPTHINVPEETAKKIASEVNNWLAINTKNQITNSKLKIGEVDD